MHSNALFECRLICVAKCGILQHIMKAIRVSESLYQLADQEASVMHRSTAGQLEFWASIGRKAEKLLDPSVVQALLHAQLADDAGSSSQKNNQKLASLIQQSQAAPESVRFLDASLVKQSLADFSGSDF